MEKVNSYQIAIAIGMKPSALCKLAQSSKSGLAAMRHIEVRNQIRETHGFDLYHSELLSFSKSLNRSAEQIMKEKFIL